MSVRVQTTDFDLGHEIKLLRENNPQTGAVVSFLGIARDFSENERIQSMTLEHYPNMTEKVLTTIISDAQHRFEISDALIIHRIGSFKPNDQIVLVAVTSTHRKAAFLACEFIMDFLKTQAPFWKKEQTENGERWVEAKQSDEMATQQWGED